MQFKNRRFLNLAIGTGVVALYAVITPPARSANTIYFSTVDAGTTKPISQWGVEVAWQKTDNMRQGITNMGVCVRGTGAENHAGDCCRRDGLPRATSAIISTVRQPMLVD